MGRSDLRLRDQCHEIAWRTARRREWHNGFTTVELLIALGLIGILLSLLLPAVQSSRETSRRIQCVNNLKQIGAAAQAHESAHGALPYTTSSHSGFHMPQQRYKFAVSPHVFLTASLDPAVFQRVDYTDIWFADFLHPTSPPSEANSELAKVSLPVFQCPSDETRPGSNNYRANMGAGLRPHPTQRGSTCYDPLDGSGAFMLRDEVRFSEFVDGLSQTALFSEKVIGDFDEAVFNPFTDRYAWSDNSNGVGCDREITLGICQVAAPPGNDNLSYSGWTWMLGGYNSTWYNHLLTPNSLTPDCQAGEAVGGGGLGIYSARSRHTGGVNTLYADGSVRFVAAAIDSDVWRSAGSRNQRLLP